MSGSPQLRSRIPADPTAQQRAASNPSVSVWVNASAGSGKTTILTNRVVRLLLAGVKPQKILCLTFTRAAAAEMALRVTRLLSLWAVCSDNELSASLADLQGHAPTPHQMTIARRLFAQVLSCPGGMRIRTLHAFGQEVLRRFPIESGLPPHFSVIEEEDARALQDETLKDLLRDAADAPDSIFAHALATLIDRLGEKTFREALRNLLREKARLAKAITDDGTVGQLITRMRSELNLAPGETEDGMIREAFAPPLFPEDDIRTAATMLLQGTPSYKKRGEAMLLWLEQKGEERLASAALYEKFFLKKDGDPFKDYGDKALLGQYPELDRIMRREATQLQSLAERRAAAATADITAAIIVFGTALIERYSAQKRGRAALDYDDLVHETLGLLQRPGIAPWILHKLDDGLDHLLVDEAQDTSRAQWQIVATLADEFFSGSTAHDNSRTLFVVGDEKQSIYSFQNADPEAFAGMRAFFQSKITAAEKAFDEIPLHVSFRSAPAILRAVDAVFADPEAAEGVSATAVGHVAHKHESLAGRVELWPLRPHAGAGKDTAPWDLPLGYENEHDPQAELAAEIAATIKGWLMRGEILHGMDRPIRPGDIMILLRKRGRFADLMVRALKQSDMAIPVTGVDRMRLIEQLPVMDLLALIQFTLLPEDDLNLATVLRGPLLNLSEDALMHLAAGRGAVSLWQRVKDAASAEAASDYLTGWLNKADFMTPFAMLSGILNQPCPASTISGRRALWMRLGVDALDPIEELLNAAQTFSRRHAPSLQAFLHWLTASNSEIKRELESGKDDAEGQVRIMTVHASKGLEAPVVFLPDTANMPRAQDVPKFLWNDANDLPFYLPGKPAAGITRQLWQSARSKQLQEYRRLLYVAMTRASHRLYVGGWELKKREADGEGTWHNLIKRGLKESESHVRDMNADHLVWEDPALPASIKKARPQVSAPVIPLPAWAVTQALAETSPEAALAPSQLARPPSAATPDQAFARGRITHRLLQSLPDVEAAKRDAVARRFLAHPQHDLTAEQQEDVSAEVMRLVNDPAFAPFFGGESRAEIPLVGTYNGKRIAGQVDRLVLVGDEVWIVDYKTNRPPPTTSAAVPDLYRQQMDAYRAILQDIYPAKAVRCFLLWTYGPLLMEMPAKAP